MRVRSNERLAVHLYLMYTLLCIPLTLLTVWLCRTLSQPFAVAAMWGSCCLQVLCASLLVWLRTLRGLRWPCSRLSIEAPLLVSRSNVVHHAQFPLLLTTHPRMTSGPSVLLLCTAAMLTIPEKNRSAAQQAVMDYLAPLKLEQGGFLRKHQQVGTRPDLGFEWSVRQDGNALRAYASGDAKAILDACDYLWDGEKKPLDQSTRDDLLALWSQEELPPMAFAMAELRGGSPCDAVFLGAMLMERSLLPYARHEVDTLRRQGYAVSLQGLEPMSGLRLSALLGCDDAPPADDPDVLTIACTDQAEGSNIYLTPDTVLPTRTVSYLRTQTHRLLYQPVQATLLLTMAALCCLCGGMGASVLAMFHALMLAQFAFAPVAPRPLPSFKADRVMTGGVLTVLLPPALCLLTAWFVRISIGDASGACILFLLPVTVLAGFLCARLSTTMRPTLTLLPVLFYAAGLVAIAVNTGVTLVSSLFALVAGTLCAMLLGALLQYADRR